MNIYMAPIYVSDTNMVTPLATISLYQETITIFNIILGVLQIVIQTTGFILKETILATFRNLTLEKIVYIIGVYNLLMLVVLDNMLVLLDNQRKKITEQKELIENLDKNIIYLNKIKTMRENFDEVWIQDVRTYHEETTQKIEAMGKRIEKLEKDLKQIE